MNPEAESEMHPTLHCRFSARGSDKRRENSKSAIDSVRVNALALIAHLKGLPNAIRQMTPRVHMIHTRSTPLWLLFHLCCVCFAPAHRRAPATAGSSKASHARRSPD